MTETEPLDGSITIFVCGPNRWKCEHDYSRYVDILDSEGKFCGQTLVCSKCGRTAYDEAQWL